MENNSLIASEILTKLEGWIRMAEMDIKIVEFLYTGGFENPDKRNKNKSQAVAFL